MSERGSGRGLAIYFGVLLVILIAVVVDWLTRGK